MPMACQEFNTTFINNKIPVLSESIGSIYKQNKDEDGFLYIQISLESTFG